MTEGEWWMSTNPRAMLTHLQAYPKTGGGPCVGQVLTERRLELFACACERHFNQYEKDPERKRRIHLKCDKYDDYIDGLCTREDVILARHDTLNEVRCDVLAI